MKRFNCKIGSLGFFNRILVLKMPKRTYCRITSVGVVLAVTIVETMSSVYIICIWYRRRA